MRTPSGTFSFTKSLTIATGPAQGNTTDVLMFWIPGAGMLNSTATNQSIEGLKAIPFSAWAVNSTDNLMTTFEADGIDLGRYNFTAQNTLPD